MAEYKRRRYLFLTTDPVHIGTGGYRLGRVDMSIVREPGTRIPKIPGTSLHGVARTYAARVYESPACAGQGINRKEGSGHCGQEKCPICYTFGYFSRGTEQEGVGYSGVVNVYDAHVLLFPVYTMIGPVWVSTVDRLQDAGFKVNNVPSNTGIYKALLTWERSDALNLGWLMVECAGKVTVELPDALNKENCFGKYWERVQNRIALLQPALFSQVVNSNLEVRTSVAIDPERGAAEEHGLFTYEALPRATFLCGEVMLDDYRKGKNTLKFPIRLTAKKNTLKPQWEGPLDVLDTGLRMIEWFGVGGMGTRGFGRMAVFGYPKISVCGKEAQDNVQQHPTT